MALMDRLLPGFNNEIAQFNHGCLDFRIMVSYSGPDAKTLQFREKITVSGTFPISWSNTLGDISYPTSKQFCIR